MFLAPYAVAEGYATQADATSVERSTLAALLRFASPEEAKVLRQQPIDRKRHLRARGEISPQRPEIGDRGRSWVPRNATGSFPHPAAERIFSGMTRRINEESLAWRNGFALPDDLRVWRVINELCSAGICGIVPSRQLLSDCITVIEHRYHHERKASWMTYSTGFAKHLSRPHGNIGRFATTCTTPWPQR